MLILKILKFLIFMCFLVISYIIARYIESKSSKDLKEARGEIEDVYSNSFKQFKYNIEKIESIDRFQNIFEKTRNRLEKRGNYLKITPSIYYLIKIFAIVLQIVILVFGKTINIFSFILPVLTFFFIDIMYFLKNMEDNEEILNDLPKVYNILEINTYAGEGIETSISQLHEVVKNKRFKEKLIKLSAEILITKQINQALDNFKNSFTLVEVDSLCLGLTQSLDSGKNKDFITNQRDILEKRNLNGKDIQTKRNNFKFIISTFIIFTGVTGILIFSFYSQIFKNISKLFS